MNRMIRIVAGACAALCVAAWTAEVLALEAGDPAPALSITRWLRGDPVEGVGQKGAHTHVIAFWATWSQPATACLAELDALQRKWQSSKVVVVAVSAEGPETITKYLAEHPECAKMQLRLAADNDQETLLAYMESAGQKALPHVFVVNREGVLAWHGHPSDLEAVVDQVVAGTFDVPESAADTAAGPIDPQLQNAYLDARQAEEWEKAVEAIDRIIARHPQLPVRHMLLVDKFTMLYERLENYDEAEEVAREVLDSHSDKAAALNAVAWTLLARGDFEQLDHRWPNIAHRAARKAFEASAGEDAAILDTYARSLYLLGFVTKAVAQQRDAISKFHIQIARARAQAGDEERVRFLESELQGMERTLQYYVAIETAGQHLAP